MTALLPGLKKRMTGADLVLAVAAVVGLGLYVWLTPAQHPLAPASYTLGEADAQQAAEAFLAAKGYAIDGLDVETSLSWHRELLNDMQADLGRPTAIQKLQVEEPAPLPVFYWEVEYRTPEADEEDEDEGRYYAVRVTQQGHVWEFDQRPERPEEGGPPPRVVDRPPRAATRFAEQRVDRQALQAAFASSVPGTEEPPEPGSVASASDSLLAAALAFAPVDSLWRAPDDTRVPEVAALQAQLEAQGGVRRGFGPEVAVALARYHLRDLPWSSDGFRVDSAWVPAERNARIAHVRLTHADSIDAQVVRADVEVSAGGALYELDFSFNPERERATDTVETVAAMVTGGLYVLLSIILIVTFFRRLMGRLIDAKAALLDGLMMGLLMAVMMALVRDIGDIQEVSGPVLHLLIRLMIALVSGAAVAVFVFLISGAADSLARAAWPNKLRTASLMRLGAYRNVYVGGTLLRGTALAFILLGLVMLVLAVFPHAVLMFDEGFGFAYETSFQPMAMHAAGNGLGAFLVLLMVLLGVGTFLYRWKPKAGVVVAGIVLTMGLVQGSQIDVEPVWIGWILSGAWGLMLGVAFWRYDFVTCVIASFLALTIWSLTEGWIVEGSSAWVDVLLAGLLVLGLLVLGLVGVSSGRTRREVGEYVPTYIQDLAREERLKRELEIARQVQESFLPRRMPNVAGLDIAAMCLAALDIGGDYYDFVQTEPGKLAVVVGDVSGKGTQAAFYMTLTKGIVQTLAHEQLPPAEVMRRVNTVFCGNAPRGTFISMIYGVLDVEARTFTFVRAGHNPIILKRSPNQEAEMLQPPGLAIGLTTGPAFDDTIREETLHLRLGDVLVFYTDGFSEAMNRDKDLYGDDRLARKVGDVGQRSANEILRAVTEDVHHFVEAAGRHDDMTMVVVKLTRGINHQPLAGQKRTAAEA